MSGSAAGGPQLPELTRQPGVTVEPLLPGERRKPGGLGDIAVIALDEMEFHVESTQADEADDIVKADCGAAGFPTGDSGLGRPGTIGELGLGETGTPTRLPDHVTAARTHTSNISDLLCLLTSVRKRMGRRNGTRRVAKMLLIENMEVL
jgi:hypothetical protein